MNASPEDPPRLPAYAAPDGTWRVWCQWCDRWHAHEPGEGLRGCHCVVVNSPYHHTGYYLVGAGEWSYEVRRQHRVKKPLLCGKCRGVYLSRQNPVCPTCGWRR